MDEYLEMRYLPLSLPPALFACALFFMVAVAAPAATPDLETKLATVQGDVAAAEKLNAELKAQLAAKEQTAAEAKAELQKLDDQIAALKKQHQLE